MEKSWTICKPTPRKKENPITDNYMIWGYRNSLKAWQLWNMKKPHHIKGCEINFYAEIIWNKIKTPSCFITSMSKLGLLGDKLFDTKEVPLEVEDCWAAPWYFVSQRELPSWHKLHIQNFTHRALERNWHTLSIICHPTSHSAVAFISPVWHSDTDFTFRTLRTDILSAVDTNFSHFSLYFLTNPQRKCSRF